MAFFRCMGGNSGVTTIYPEFVASVNNTDSSGSSNVTYSYSGSAQVTEANFFKELTSVYFSGSNSYTCTTTFNSYINSLLNYSWTTQSGSTKQWFNILFVEDLTKVHVVNDWETYTSSGWHEYTLPDGVLATSTIVDFRNVKSGGGSLSQTSVQKVQAGNKLRVYIPVASGSPSIDIRILALY